ncbi:hypothetical protein BW731_10380 [Vagococcus martis]|uniref:Nudix hydrolase domain-containing protein n=1 Tax=Vagococcus martis TaxID=1768210 RepID=A0A1V4DJR2_9ENTE|nr:hypothetical protein [Vagococcus martis]OPF88546.1 hypothetical protein BW731_10380 [Vagococcus martis]
MENQRFRILIWIEHNNHVLVATTKTGEKQLLEVTPNDAETTLEAIERYGEEILDLHFDVVNFVDLIEQTTHEHFNQTETLFLYRASLKKDEILPKLTHSQIIYWLPINKAEEIVSSQLISKMTKI